jgi:HK97 family phage major capsid protein
MPDEIQTKLDVALKGIATLQDAAKNHKATEDGLAKATADITGALDEVSKLQATQKAHEEHVAKLEKMLCGMSAAPKDNENEKEVVAKADFTRYLRKGTSIPDASVTHIVNALVQKHYFGLNQNEEAMVRKDLQVGVDPDGGYWVRPEVLDKTITRIFETSPVRQYASAITTNSDSVEMFIDDNEPTAGWVGETQTRAKTDTPQIGQHKIFVHEMYAKPQATQKLLDDVGFDVEAWLQNHVSAKFSRLENTAFVVGNGVLKPRGFLTYPAWTTPGTYQRGAIEQLESATSSTLAADDIKKLQNILLEEYQNDARWYMNRATFGLIVLLKDTVTGRYLLDPNSFKVGDTKILEGSEVVFMSDIPTVAASSLSIVYGSLNRGYMIVDRIGIRVLRDPYSNKPFIEYYTTKRVGGDVVSYDSLKILKIKA